MNKEEKLALATRELANRELSRRRLLHFTQNTLENYEPGWVHHDICARLERFSKAVAEKKSPRLMLLVPPRHGKSELASIRLPAWHLGHHPNHEIINVGYNLDLPMIFSKKVRALLRDPYYQQLFPETVMDPDTQATEAWMTTRGGGFKAAGVGGGITGKGAHILIIDDPLKNMEEADSADRRELLDNWYQSTAYTRLAPGGGVLFIECMVGDTPVRMADGTERRLDEIKAGDEIASYEDGNLVTTTVAAQKLSGRDSVLKITMTSGKVVRANGRHPFLTSDNGRLQWTRARALTTAHRIVTLPDNGANGAESSAQQTGANSQPSAEGSVTATTTNKSGRLGTGLLSSLIQRISALDILNTGTELLRRSTMRNSLRKKASALSAENFLTWLRRQHIGKTSSASTIVTPLGKFAICSVTNATSHLDSFELSGLHSPWLNTSDFTTDRITKIEPDGEADVYDLQVDRTENFIANGLVTHNTWWNYDDLAGRLQQRMKLDPDADQFEVVLYPALSTHYEYRDETTFEIIRSVEPLDPKPHNVVELRPIDTALHEARYSTATLKKMKSNIFPRIWSALYQQAPMPDEGIYFKKEHFRVIPKWAPSPEAQFYTAWDFAIGLKQMNDFTVGATISVNAADTCYVEDVSRFKGDTFEIVETMLNVAERYTSQSGGKYIMGVEDGQIWKAIEPVLRKRMDERKLYPSIQTMKPLTDKMARARPLQGRMQQGKVVFPENATWLQEVFREMLQFPGGSHDDAVDALAWVVRLSMQNPTPRQEEKKRKESWKDKLKVGSTHGLTHMSA